MPQALKWRRAFAPSSSSPSLSQVSGAESIQFPEESYSIGFIERLSGFGCRASGFGA